MSMDAPLEADTHGAPAFFNPPVKDRPQAVATSGALDVIARIGQLTRALHDSLHALGYDKELEAAASSIPDACDRLAYIANMTEHAAERTLNATEMARPIQEKLSEDACALSARWDQLFAAHPGVEEFNTLVVQTREYLGRVPAHTYATNVQLSEIMMAQNFQDLTGQLIKKITEIVHQLEQQLLKLLAENIPAEKRPAHNGSAVAWADNNERIFTQTEVDELLESLDF